MTYFLITILLFALIAFGASKALSGASLTQFDSPMPPTTHPRAQPSAGYPDVEKFLYDNFTAPAVGTSAGLDAFLSKRDRFEAIGLGRDFHAESGVTLTVDSFKHADVTIDGEWATTENSDPSKRILYLHGGAFTVGSAISHRPIAAQLAKRTGCSVFTPNYRLLPENTRIDGITDSKAAYAWILENGPDGPATVKSLAVGGDSAGGNLTLMVIAWARDTGLRAAECAFGLSPVTDASLSAPSVRRNFETDIMLKPLFAPIRKVPNWLIQLSLWKQAGVRAIDPRLSPLRGDLAQLPPILLIASTAEMLHDDSVRYTHKARAAGTDVTLQTWDHVPHVWPIFDRELEESDEAFGEIAKFIAAHFKR